MIPELGTIFLIFGLVLSMAQASFVFVKLFYDLCKTKYSCSNYSKFVMELIYPQVFFILLSFFCLFYCICSNDFSVAYVARNSNSTLPLIYKVSSFWSAYEGSFLLWLGILIIFTGFLKYYSVITLYLELRACLFSVLGVVMLCFYIFILFTSNPFKRIIFNQPLEGLDLNPLLQDIGLILHPPILYIGYVGFTIVFAYTLAYLLCETQVTSLYLWVRPFVYCGWSFLTLGIVLGSWWAYYELGWGGWWFWDPVENVALLPWLTSTMLIHTLLSNKKQSDLYKLSFFLGILTFILCLFGTFLVRSGIVASIHAFMADKSRLLYMLFFFIFFLVFSILVWVLSITKFSEVSALVRRLCSRNFFLYVLYFLLFLIFIFILLGIVYPLYSKYILNTNIFIDANYYNTITIPIFFLLFILISYVMNISWLGLILTSNLLLFFFLNVGFFVIFLYFFLIFKLQYLIYIVFFFSLLFFINYLSYLVKYLYIECTLKKILDFIKYYCVMFTAHTGFVLVFVGILIVSLYSIEKNIIFKVGDLYKLGEFEIKFEGIEEIEDINYIGYRGIFSIYNENNIIISKVYPEKRVYLNSGLAISEVALYPTVLFDIYIGLTEPLRNSEWSCVLQYKPAVRVIWLGGVVIFSSGFLIYLRRLRRLM